MLCLTYKATSLVEGVNEDGVHVVLLIDLEIQVSAKDIVEIRHFVSIHW